jgi:hypothetical protein
MADPKGYRVDRLRRRRRSKLERWQAWTLYVLAVVVAFAAVWGAWYLGGRLVGKKETPRKPGYLALIKLTSDKGEPVAAALAIKDASGAYSLYVIPRDLLLDGPEGEYVFAADSMTAGTFKEDLQRVIGAKVDAVYSIPVSSLAKLAGTDQLQLSLSKPVQLPVGGTDAKFKDKAVVQTSAIPELMAATGPSGTDSADMQQALWTAVLQAAALRPADARAATARSVAAGAAAVNSGATPATAGVLTDALRGLTGGQATVAQVPATTRVAEGQFAFVPDPAGIMAAITRKAPDYSSQYTVLVRNGTGAVGAGEAVAKRLAVLDVNLPPVGNAASFDYRQTQIIAGRKAVPVAQDIRAILGRGVVLDGADLPADTVVVVVGRDLNP